MITDKKFIAEQVQRLSGLDYFPRSPNALKELGLALECALTSVIVVAVVNSWIESQREAPKPADLRRMVWDENERIQQQADEAALRLEEKRRAYHCPRCQDFGFYGGHLGGQYAGPWKWCDCESGRIKQMREPHLVDEANTARNKLLAIGVKDPLYRLRQSVDGQDEYRGEF